MSAVTSVKETILLTGAGLTKNFGGLLASEMWAAIISNPSLHEHSKLMALLRSSFDFEEIYNSAISGKQFSDEEKVLLSDAIRAAYLNQEDTLSNW
ncbi:MAG: hypothetical protein WC712_15255, partial [Candidatus Brocadiia bacterium]